jgi:hypothetical protein
MTIGELSRRRFLGTTTATIGAIGLPSLLATEAEAAGRVPLQLRDRHLAGR